MMRYRVQDKIIVVNYLPLKERGILPVDGEMDDNEPFFWDGYLNARGRTMMATLIRPTIEIIVLDALRASAMHEVTIVSLIGLVVLPDYRVVFEDQIKVITQGKLREMSKPCSLDISITGP